MSPFLKNWPVKVLGGRCLSVWWPLPRCLFGVVKQFNWFGIGSNTQCMIPVYALHTTRSPPPAVTHCLNTYPHCKKSWWRSSTPASGDAGPIHTGVEKSFRHPWRKFYYKYRTYCLQMSNFFDRAWIFQKQHRLGSNLQSSHPQSFTLPLRHTYLM